MGKKNKKNTANHKGKDENIKNTENGKPVFFSDLYMAAREAMYENVKEAMKVFGKLA